MKPIKLEIEGLQSFLDKQIIDFKELTSLGLFGIFGETGSGKSTILDAMILALYDKIPRIMGSQEKGIHQCLNQNSNMIYVNFEFALGKDIYKIVRCYKKRVTKKGEEKFTQQNPLLYKNNIVIADTVTEVKNKIDECLGIDVNDFTRSVVLPQGKFSEFLKLKGLDKIKMLENIFELEKYGSRLTDKLKLKSNSLKSKIEAINNQIKGKGDISIVDIKSLENECHSFENLLSELKIEKDRVEKEFLEKKTIVELLEKKEFYEDELKKILDIKDEIENKKSILEQHNNAYKYKSEIKEVENLKKQYNFLKENVVLKEKEFENINKEFEEIELLEQEGKMNLSTIEKEYIENRYDYQYLKDLRAGFDILKSKNYYLDQVKEIEQKKSALKNENLKYEDEKKEIEKRLIELNILDILKKEKDDLKNKIESIERSQKEISEKRKKCFDEKKRLEEIVESLSIKERDLKEFLDQKNNEEEIKKSEFINGLAKKIKSELKIGDNCPVCGNIYSESLKENIENIELSSYELYENERKKRLEKELTLKKEIEFLNIERKKIVIDDENILEKEYNDICEIVSNLKKELEKLTDKILETDKNKVKLSTEIEKIEHFITNNYKDIDAIEEKLLDLKSKKEVLDSELSNYKMFCEKKIEVLAVEKMELEEKEKKIDSILKRKNEIENEYRKIKIVFDEKKEKKIHIKSQLENEYFRESECKDNLKIKYENLKNKITKDNFLSISQVLESILDDEYAKSISDEISTYINSCIKISSLKEENEKNLNGRFCGDEEYISTKKNLEYLIEKEKEEEKKYNLKKAELERALTTLSEIKELKIQNDIFEKELDDIVLLQKKFEGKKFVKFLARKKLNYIVFQASSRLKKITKGRYTLNIDDNCDFNIVDSFNENKIRACSTLSGGETFVVSLSLALALSSQLQLKGNIQLEFFFLDEGFGTLDSVLLDRVIEILEEIKWKEKLKIGIISHVEDLKIRIPRRIEVSSAIPGEKGSTIKMI